MADHLAPPQENHSVFKSWLDDNGAKEYDRYKEESANPHLSYQEWSVSDEPLGAFLYHLTLIAWEEVSTDSSDESEREDATQGSEQVPTSKVTRNGNGLPHAPRSTKLIPEGTFSDLSELPVRGGRHEPQKQKLTVKLGRKSKDDASKNGTALAAAENSAERDTVERPLKKHKQKKRVVSEPAAGSLEEDRFYSMFNGQSQSSASNTPDGPSPSSIARRGLRTRTPAQQRPYFHNAKIFEEAELAEQDPERGPKSSPHPRTKLAQVSYPNSEDLSDDTRAQTAELSDLTPLSRSPVPELPSSELQPRRVSKGGRPWRKGEEDEDDDYLIASKKKISKKGKGGRKSMEKSSAGHAETVPATASSSATKAGRKARKSALSQEFVQDGSDSDTGEVQTQATLPQAGPLAGPFVGNQPDDHNGSPRPKRRPRKSYVSEEFVHDESDSEGLPDDGAIEKTGSPAPKKETKVKRRSLKSYKSQEFIQDDTDTDMGEVKEVAPKVPVTPAEKPKGKKRGRPRKDKSDVKPEKKTRGRPRKSDPGPTITAPITTPITGSQEDTISLVDSERTESKPPSPEPYYHYYPNDPIVRSNQPASDPILPILQHSGLFEALSDPIPSEIKPQTDNNVSNTD